jgi:short-subunit dehydrogenase
VIGAANTLRVFVPVMATQRQRSIVEITASSAGVMFGSAGPYGSSKLAAVGLGEELHKELEAMPGRPLERVRVVVLCPALVQTDLLQSGEAASGGVAKAEHGRSGDVASVSSVENFRALLASGMSANHCAEEVFRHAHFGQFYCIVDNSVVRDGMTMELDARITDRFKAMISRDLGKHCVSRGIFPGALSSSQPPPSSKL